MSHGGEELASESSLLSLLSLRQGEDDVQKPQWSPKLLQLAPREEDVPTSSSRPKLQVLRHGKEGGFDPMGLSHASLGCIKPGAKQRLPSGCWNESHAGIFRLAGGRTNNDRHSRSGEVPVLELGGEQGGDIGGEPGGEQGGEQGGQQGGEQGGDT